MNKFRRVISCGSLCFSLLFAVGCNNTTDENTSTDSSESTVEDINNGIMGIYESYRKNAENKGENPLDYETWLASIKGEKGDPGVDGKNGKSAFETYCEYHPEYTKSEEEWINEFCKEYLGEAGEYTYDSSCNNFAFKEAVIDGIRGYIATFYFGCYINNAKDIVIPSYYNNLPVIGVLPEYTHELDGGWCPEEPEEKLKSIRFPKTIKLILLEDIIDGADVDLYFEGDVKYILDFINKSNSTSQISRLFFDGTVDEFLKTNLSKYFCKTDIYFKKGNDYICELPQKSKYESISNSFRNIIQNLKEGIQLSLRKYRKFTLPNSIDITFNGESISYIPSYNIYGLSYESSSYIVTPFSFDFSSEEFDYLFDYEGDSIQLGATIKCSEFLSVYTSLIIYSYIPQWSYNEKSHWREYTYYYENSKVDEEKHTFEDVVTPPTYESGGYTTHKCNVCGYEYIDSYTERMEDTNPQNLLFTLLDDGTYEVTAQDSRLTEIVIPKSYCGRPVTRIGQMAFNHCYSLTSITIPDSIVSIGDSHFYGCLSLKTINVDSLNSNFSSEDGILYNKEKTTLIKYPSGKTESQFSIPNSVTFIGDEAMTDCKSLTSIIVPNSVKTIGMYAFSYSSIISLTIPSTVMSIGKDAFTECRDLVLINYDGSMTQWNYIIDGYDWKRVNDALIIHCSDGDIKVFSTL